MNPTEKQIKMIQIAARLWQMIKYFGLAWLIALIICLVDEKIDHLNPDDFYPQCIDGARACPPKDSHGIGAYAEFLDAVQDPYHYDHEGSLEWIKGYFDPEHFNLDLINKKLKHGQWAPSGFIAS